MRYTPVKDDVFGNIREKTSQYFSSPSFEGLTDFYLSCSDFFLDCSWVLLAIESYHESKDTDLLNNIEVSWREIVTEYRTLLRETRALPNSDFDLIAPWSFTHGIIYRGIDLIVNELPNETHQWHPYNIIDILNTCTSISFEYYAGVALSLQYISRIRDKVDVVGDKAFASGLEVTKEILDTRTEFYREFDEFSHNISSFNLSKKLMNNTHFKSILSGLCSLDVKDHKENSIDKLLSDLSGQIFPQGKNAQIEDSNLPEDIDDLEF